MTINQKPNETIEQVKQIIAEQLGVEEAKVSASASFVDDLGADSLDIVELVMELEEEFEITIPDDQAEKIKTVGEAIILQMLRPVVTGVKVYSVDSNVKFGGEFAAK